MKKCSILLVIREMQTQTTAINEIPLYRMANFRMAKIKHWCVADNAEELELS